MLKQPGGKIHVGASALLRLSLAAVSATWNQIEPLQDAPWLGRLLAADLLRRLGKTRSISSV